MGKNEISMVVVLFLFVAAACYLPINVSAARNVPAKNKFIVEGKVFCDSCQFGYETPLSTYLAGNPSTRLVLLGIGVVVVVLVCFWVDLDLDGGSLL